MGKLIDGHTMQEYVDMGNKAINKIKGEEINNNGLLILKKESKKNKRR